MPSLPVVTARETISALESAGFSVVRQKGAHAILKREGHTFLITVPVHRGNLATGTVRRITKDAGMTVEHFRDML